MANKYNDVAELIRISGAVSVLDVGCRDCRLREAIDLCSEDPVEYTGLDLYQNDQGSVDIVCDISGGIPANDRSYDIVVGLDVLEHLDDLQGGLDELLRVARSHVIVVLPNLAHFLHRVRFCFTGRLSGKYDLHFDGLSDRHRWLTVVPQTDDFISKYCTKRGIKFSSSDLSAGRRTGYAERLLCFLGFDRSWHVWAVTYTLMKPRMSSRSGDDSLNPTETLAKP